MFLSGACAAAVSAINSAPSVRDPACWPVSSCHWCQVQFCANCHYIHRPHFDHYHLLYVRHPHSTFLHLFYVHPAADEPVAPTLASGAAAHSPHAGAAGTAMQPAAELP